MGNTLTQEVRRTTSLLYLSFSGVWGDSRASPEVLAFANLSLTEPFKESSSRPPSPLVGETKVQPRSERVPLEESVPDDETYLVAELANALGQEYVKHALLEAQRRVENRSLSACGDGILCSSTRSPTTIDVISVRLVFRYHC